VACGVKTKQMRQPKTMQATTTTTMVILSMAKGRIYHGEEEDTVKPYVLTMVISTQIKIYS
jgi:hypothetical protein